MNDNFVKAKPLDLDAKDLKLFGLDIGHYQDWEDIDVGVIELRGVYLSPLGREIFPAFPPEAKDRYLSLYIDTTEGLFAYRYNDMYGAESETPVALPHVPMAPNWFRIAKEWDTFFPRQWKEFQEDLKDQTADTPALAAHPLVKQLLA